MSTVAKRKAQDLVRNGKVQDAIQKMRDLVTEGEADPYDHVYLGDLLMRVGERDDALAAYQQAIRSYEAVGLNRNAIAIAKKVVRIDGARPDVHRSLAQLYESEGLATEALPHYLVYLDSFSGEAVPPTEFLETLDQAAAITGTRVEVALRLVEHFQRIRRHGRAAELLEEVADNAAEAGSEDIAVDLRARAAEAHRAANEVEESAPSVGSADLAPAMLDAALPEPESPGLPALPDAIEDGVSAAGSDRSDQADGATIDLSGIPEPEPVELPTDLSTFGEETGAPFQLDRGAMEEALGGKSEPKHEPAEHDEPGGFEVEHFPVSGARANNGEDGASHEAGATFGQIDLDASVNGPEADAGASSSEPVWQIDEPGTASSNGVET
ncbi:MAG: tetratricopeptide repeat protein, partial [Candidatus Eisenbacteria bacterium]|nr:tetratricopeptide repeat protein [Candidatus Eisenbacteria bacterium]